MHATVVICTWNRAEMLAQALASVAAMRLPEQIDWEVLVVDNNSTDGTRSACEAFVARRPDRHRYLFEGRQGKSYALNTAIAEARGEIIVFTDDDVTVHADWLAEIVRTFEAHKCGIIAGRIVAVWGRPIPKWFVDEGPHAQMAAIVRFEHGDVAREIEATPFGANMAIRRELFASLGGFRTDLGPTAGSELKGEDTELCRRFRAAGTRVVYAPTAIVYHPVEEKRSRKEYFLAWYFDYGRAQMRTQKLGPEVRRYFGVPRFLYRRLIEYGLMWWLGLGDRRRFHYKLCTWQTLGEIRESRRISTEMGYGGR